VLLTQLCKYDGTRTRILSAREFHQIVGRAGRAGFDVAGTVWAQAPEHVIDNERAAPKAAGTGKKARKVVKRKAPERGFVPWSEDTFTKLIAAAPEPLASSFTVSHAMLLNTLDRPDGGLDALKRLLTDNHEPRAAQRRHIRRAVAIARSLLSGNIVERLVRPDGSVDARVATDLQRDFSLNQPLSPFVLEALTHLDEDEPTHALDVLSMVESSLEDPGQVLAAQLWKRKTEVINELKAQGVEYEERMEILETIEHPKPLRELTYGLFDTYRQRHPWVADHNVKPKSVARDMYERAMSFAEFIDHYGLARSEGLVLRYLTDAYKAMVQNVPEDAKTDAVYDLTEWLGETVRQVDSSLLDEWDQLRAGVEPAAVHPTLPEVPPSLTANTRAFRVMVRNRVFHLVELAARKANGELADATGWEWERWAEALAPYWEAHTSIGTGPAARGGELFQVVEGERSWSVRQVLDDPSGDHDWAITATVDLAASDEEGEPVIEVLALSD
jgi:hypothetical protein